MAGHFTAPCRDCLSRRGFLDARRGIGCNVRYPRRPCLAAEKAPGMDKVLLFGEPSAKYLEESQITSDFELPVKKLAIRIEVVSRNELKSVYDNLSDDRRREAVSTVKRLVDEAQQEGRPRPGDAEIEAAVRYSMAMHAIVVEHGAMAANLHCGSFPPGKGPGPCAALTLLQDRGVPAGCQGDVDALLTMVLFQRAAGVVSFMGNPGVQGARLSVTHCVLSRAMKSPDALSPYYLADHHGSHTGVTIHTDLPAGEPVTVARLTRNLERLIIAEGVVADSSDPAKGCRNRLLIDVPDVRRLMSVVRGGQYHLVVACGRHLTKLQRLADQAGIEVFT